MFDRLLVLVSLALIAAACGDQDCPAGTVAAGEGCVAVDGDGGASDASVPEDGAVPDGCTPAMVYRDGDGDGFGDAADSMTVCGTPPMGYVAVPPGDCDDTAATINPNASETCDDVDQDCDGAVDEGRLGLMGSPRSIGEHNRMGAAPNIDPFSAGYVTVWNQETQAVWLLLDDTGSPSSSQAGIDTASMGAGQHDPSMAVVETMSGTERAVVAWATDDGTIRARSLRLDGLTSPASVVIAVGDGTTLVTPIRVVEWDQRALLIWAPIILGDPSTVHAQLLDPATAMPIGSAITILERARTSIFMAPGVGVLSDGGALVAASNDADGTYFAARLTTDGTTLDLAETVTITPPQPLTTSSQITPVANSRAQGVLFVEGDLGLGYIPLGVGPLTETTPSLMVGDGVTELFAAQDRSVILSLSGTEGLTMLPLEVTQLVRTMGVEQLARSYLFDMEIDDFHGADIAVEDDAHAAVLLATITKGSPDVRFLRLGCR